MANGPSQRSGPSTWTKIDIVVSLYASIDIDIDINIDIYV